MSRITGTLCLILLNISVFGWGITGHRAIGEVAEGYLTKKTKKHVNALLRTESMAIASVWMDNVKSDKSYNHMYDWHWVTIPNGMTYEEADKNPNGDIIVTIERLTSELKARALTGNDEVEALKMLIHLIGDIHQPLHVGDGTDQGGNDLKLKWFWNDSNLHRVWDSQMIDRKRLSFTELAKTVNYCSIEQVKAWQQASVRDWASESYHLRKQVYDVPEDNNIRYKYVYKNWDTLKLRLLQAGVRLAGVLNDIYG